MPQFVVLLHSMPPHAGRPTHWDLMFEQEDGLRTWALTAAPDSASTISAIPLPIHRRHYLDYEGPVSGDLGHVCRWDAGSLQWKQNQEDQVWAAVWGSILRGDIRITKTGDVWQLQYRASDQTD